MYRQLDSTHIVKTLERLERRIDERFNGAGLAAVCRELTAIARHAHTRSVEISRPDWRLRGFVAAVLAIGFGVLVWLAIALASRTDTNDDLFDTLGAIDSTFSILLLMGASVFFMVGLEDRRRRGKALAALHELRSIIHVIDMHQLTKDPSSDVTISTPTASSPARPLSPEQVVRYLDYCSEMVSLASKVAALYAQSYPDAVVSDAVSDLERTASGLSQKIWQKINIIHRELDHRDHPVQPA